MDKDRIIAFSDGVIAIIITIIVLMIDIPQRGDLTGLKEMLPLILYYGLSFILIGMRWTNHHHLFQLTGKIDGKVLWANLLYLFTLSLFPVATGWIGKTAFAYIPTIFFAVVNLLETISFLILERAIISCDDNKAIRLAIGNEKKEILSIGLEAAAVGLGFFNGIHALAYILLLVMSALWIIPDLRMKQVYNDQCQ